MQSDLPCLSCSAPSVSRQLCLRCYQAARRHGTWELAQAHAKRTTMVQGDSACAECAERPAVVRGVCRRCYRVRRKAGTLGGLVQPHAKAYADVDGLCFEDIADEFLTPHKDGGPRCKCGLILPCEGHTNSAWLATHQREMPSFPSVDGE